MAKAQTWKKGRGKLGPLAPILGHWRAEADSPMGPVSCERIYEKFGDGWVRLDVTWSFGKPGGGPGAGPGGYREVAIFGPGDDGALAYWSFTSDGKRSTGRLADAADVHAQALCFESQMPAGLARQVFWPDETAGMLWAVEAKTKKGWNRFTRHHYRRVG